MGILTKTLVAAGLGRTEEAQAGLAIFEHHAGQDIAVQALFREITSHFENNSPAAEVEPVEWMLDRLHNREPEEPSQ